MDLHGTLSQVEGLKSFVGRVDRASHLPRAPNSSPIHRSAWKENSAKVVSAILNMQVHEGGAMQDAGGELLLKGILRSSA